MFQPVVNLSYFFELKILAQKVYGNILAYNEEEIDSIEYQKTIGQATKGAQLNKKREMLLSEFMEMKLYEAYVESGPQSIFQLMRVIQRGFSSPLQCFTLVLSIVSLTLAGAQFFWSCPTQVCNSVCIDLKSKRLAKTFIYASRILLNEVDELEKQCLCCHLCSFVSSVVFSALLMSLHFVAHMDQPLHL